MIKYYSWVDYAKGIGILLVVYGHVARGVYNAGMMSTDALYKYVDSVIYSFHMPLFFFLSGLFFVGSLNKRGIKGLVFSKISTLVYPYFVWSIIQGIIGYLFNSVTNSAVILSNMYSIFWCPYDQFWFLYVLFIIFLIYSLIHRYTKSVLLTFLISFIAFSLQAYLYTPWNIFNFVFKYGVFFCGGMLVSSYIKLPNKKIGVCVVLSMLIFSIVQWIYHSNLPLYYGLEKNLVLGFVAFVSIACIVFIALLFNDLNINIVRYIGQFSFEIYLAHIIFASGFRIVFQKLFDFESVIFHLICGTIVGVVGSILLVWVVKKVHLLCLFYVPNILRYSDMKNKKS